MTPHDATDGKGHPTSVADRKNLRMAALFAEPAIVGVLFVLLAVLTWRTKYFRAMFLPALLIGFMFLWGYSEHMYSLKRRPVGSSSDQIVTFGPGVAQGDAIKTALDWMK
jgi:hypothetical protein